MKNRKREICTSGSVREFVSESRNRGMNRAGTGSKGSGNRVKEGLASIWVERRSGGEEQVEFCIIQAKRLHHRRLRGEMIGVAVQIVLLLVL
jgi:hypothetical protein